MERSTSDLGDLSLDQLVELERRAAEAEAEAEVEADVEAGSTAGGASDHLREPVMLPWWQRPFNIVVVVVTAAILAAMVGWMVGDAGSDPAHNDVDTGFLQDMRTHHEQAVLIGYIYRSRDDIDPGLSTVARSIINGQNIEVGRMIQMLRDLGETEANETGTSMLWMEMVAEANQMPGIASEEELAELARVDGREADELFVELMSRHHLGGIEMAEFEIEFGEYDEAIRMAEAMAGAQTAEIGEMVGRLEASRP
jgi:uncharacterized protein (DUF305 family)